MCLLNECRSLSLNETNFSKSRLTGSIEIKSNSASLSVSRSAIKRMQGDN